RDEAQVELQPVLLARAARLVLPRRLVAVGEVRLVAASAPPTAGEPQAIALAHHLADHGAGLGVGGDGARRNLDLETRPVRTRAVAGSAVLTPRRAELGVIAQRQQGVLVGDGDQM